MSKIPNGNDKPNGEQEENSAPSQGPARLTKARKAGRLTLIVLVAGILAFDFYLLRSNTGPGSQRANMAAAQASLSSLQSILLNDNRFRDISCSPMTAHGGCLSIHGNLASAAHAESLRETVLRTQPAVDVHFYVTIRETESVTIRAIDVP